MANVSLKHIYKVYPNGVKAVNDFNMEIKDKEFIVFVGPSGCGKSTTLRMIAGLEEITAGELRIDDEVVNDMEPKDRDIAMVFQNYALYPHMTVYENMAFGLKIRKVPKDEIHKRILEAAEILGITEYLDRKPKAMSGGQRQRVALGRAILRNPKVFLLDEPLSNLDAKLRTQMRAEIAKLHNKLQTTFIYVTHDQVEAMTMGTRIVVMRDGVVQQIEKPKDLYRYPANKFVAGFIGTPQMNFFEGTLTPEGNNVRVKFRYTESEVVVPRTYFLKVKPKYLDGKTIVTIGLRCENISLDPKQIESADAIMDVRISHLEELGTETLVYGDLNMCGDGYTESSTRVIIKANGYDDFEKGSIVKAAFSFNNIHLFDIETEESILPRLPKEIAVPCTVENNTLDISGTKINLPKAINCKDLEGTILIPVDAVKLGGDIKTKIHMVEKVNDKYLNYHEVGTQMLFTVTEEPLEEGSLVNVSIDIKRVNIMDNENNLVVRELPYVNHIPAEYRKVKGKIKVETTNGTKEKNGYNFFFNVSGKVFETPDDLSKKIFAAFDTLAFDKKYTIDADLYQLKIVEEGISAKVKGILDYGTEKFACLELDGNTYYALTDKELGDTVNISFDLNEVGLTESTINMKLV